VEVDAVNEFPGEDERVRLLLESCEHELYVLVCVDCGAAAPAPEPGYVFEEGQVVSP